MHSMSLVELIMVLVTLRELTNELVLGEQHCLSKRVTSLRLCEAGLRRADCTTFIVELLKECLLCWQAYALVFTEFDKSVNANRSRLAISQFDRQTENLKR
jgi:hypothetical protein